MTRSLGVFSKKMRPARSEYYYIYFYGDLFMFIYA